jgi:Xaa-Pro dipeptidase
MTKKTIIYRKDIGILNIQDEEFVYRGRRKGLGLESLTRPLEENMVVTVEPGLYFNNVSIDLWTKHPDYRQYFDMTKINQYRVIGGVRIEDTVVITRSGHENFTIAPKEINDIEAIMQQ